MEFDVAVVGAGIAGAAAAYDISRTHRVILIEREDQPGYHSTGRSAALYTETYGPPAIRALARASRPFLESPPRGFADVPLLSPRGVMFIARDDQRPATTEFLALAHASAEGRAAIVEIDAVQAAAMVPILAPGYVRQAYLERGARDLDVHAIHQGFLRGLRAQGGRLATDAEVLDLRRRRGIWHVATRAGEFRVAAVVNAAGAWADAIAGLAGAAPSGLVPKRRTALIAALPPDIHCAGWPMVCCVAETFYFKPDAGRLLVSPADETPSPPCDAQPEDIDIAIAIDRLERATTLSVGSVVRKWAGLRSFVADHVPVVGRDPDLPGFFWLAGQGGYGIKTSPALGRVIGACVRGEALADDLAACGVSAVALAPGRLHGMDAADDN